MKYQEPIFFEPVFQQRIWGGKKLNVLFGYEIPTDKTGEAWVISAHKGGTSIVANGPLQGQNLLEVWHAHPSLFGKVNPSGDFPLLVKVLDANDDLSVQVHPDDDYARQVEGEQNGKSECWYVLNCEPASEIIIGHRAESDEDFRRRVASGNWDELLNRIKVEKGDFFYVPSGTVHAIGQGIVMLEIQQSSDVTYRLYDYDRKDSDGNSRELHIQSAIEVITYPHSSMILKKVEETIDDLVCSQLMKEKCFTVYHWKLNGKVTTPLLVDYLLVSVISGKGEIIVNKSAYPISAGDHLIIPATLEHYEIEGNLEIIASHT